MLGGFSESAPSRAGTWDGEGSLIFARAVGSLGAHLESADFTIGHTGEGEAEDEDVAGGQRVGSESEI